MENHHGPSTATTRRSLGVVGSQAEPGNQNVGREADYIGRSLLATSVIAAGRARESFCQNDNGFVIPAVPIRTSKARPKRRNYRFSSDLKRRCDSLARGLPYTGDLPALSAIMTAAEMRGEKSQAVVEILVVSIIGGF